MIERIEGLPDHVLGYTASGKITAEDYKKVMGPDVEALLAKHPKVRLLYHLGSEFEGFDTVALLDDAKMGLKSLDAWEKIAVVTDVEWVGRTVKILGFAMPGEIKAFPEAELDAAKSWLGH